MRRSETPHDVLMKILKEKHSQLSQIMETNNIDCWLIFARETETNPDPIQNLVIGGEVVWQSAFIFYLKDNVLNKIAIVGNFDADAEKNKQIWDEVIDYKESINELLKSKIKNIDPKKIALNYSIEDFVSDGLTHGMYLKLEIILQEFKDRFTSAQPIIQAIRSRKSLTEIDLITKACELTETINRKISLQLQLGMTEIEIQNLYHDEMEKKGVKEAWEKINCPAIDSGPNKVFGHISPSNLKIQKNHTLHNDFGVKLNGYCSDLQRMWFFGSLTEISQELNHAFNTVYNAITKAADFIKPGVKGYEVDKIAREYVTSRGYEEFAHGLGHQLGTNAHDGGVLLAPLWEKYGNLPNGKVEVDNVFTLELHVKTKNYGMVSLEENIIITETGCKFIVPRQESWNLIG